MTQHPRMLLAAAGLGTGLLAAAPMTTHADSTAPGFSAVYVSTSLAGGEPFVIYSHAGNDLVYSGHEGTTHLYNGGGAPQPGDVCDIHTAQGFVCSYDNQVNNWYSTDGGATWTRSPGNPLYTGFSDPSLTEDEGDAANGIAPLVYNTGINLANDALFASQDGGNTWIAGTPQCPNDGGDRPWLAGGKSGEVFMGTDGNNNGHEVFKGTVTFDPVTHTALSITCSAGSIFDPAASSGSGIGGQLYYDHNTGDLIEPARYDHGQLGISVLQNADSADFSSPTGASTSSFVSRPDKNLNTTYNDLLGPRIIIGRDNTIYMVWATGPTSATSTNGCGGNATPLANQILLDSTKDEGVTWSGPKVVAQMTNSVAWWPWIAAGAPGNVSIVWYQSDQVTDPDCDSAHSVLNSHSTSWTVRVANIFGAASATYPVQSVNAVPADSLHPGGVIHVGAICQNGTTCALNTTAGNEDRRLGDYFTNALDQNGCVMIATADTQLTDSTPVAGGGGFRTGRPLFVHQVSGPSLTTGLPCGAPTASTPDAPWLPGLLLAGGAGAAVAVLGRRRRLRSAS